MTSLGQKVLLVEGDSDERFFLGLLEYLQLKDKINIAKPPGSGGKPSALKFLDTLLKRLYQKEGITHLGMVIDADYPQYGEGYKKSLNDIHNIIKKHQYNELDGLSPGLSFSHNNGFMPFGLWIMPDNYSDGMFEDWVEKCIKDVDRYPLLEHAKVVIKGLPEVRFKEIQRTKAEISTWMAWQEKPGEGLHKIIPRKFIDLNCVPFINLIEWIKRIYSINY